MGKTVYGDDPTRPLRANFGSRQEWMRAYSTWWQRLKRRIPRDLEREKVMGARGAPVPEGAPPRPRRIDYLDSKAYHRAYESWRGKYDPTRIAARQARSRAYQEKHKDRLLADKRAQYEADPQKFKERQARWRDANRNKLQVRDQGRYETNSLYFKLAAKKRKAAIKRASPPWLTVEHWAEINSIYEEAIRLTKEIGVYFVVDHIWPLQGKNSCGLHVPWNLQVVSAETNNRKGNREPES